MVNKMRRDKDISRLTSQDKDEIIKIKEKIKKAQQKEPTKLSQDLQAFNNSIITIIMTIIVLEIKPPIHELHYGYFLANIGIFLITFFIIGSFWYDLHIAFLYFVRKPTRITAILDMLFLVVLAIFPVMTEWIMNEHSTFAVINYGIVFLIVQLLKIAVEYSGAKPEFKNSRIMNVFLVRYSIGRILSSISINIFLIILSIWYPGIAMILYLIIPIISLLTPTHNLGLR
ncbi:putative membrane protein [Lactobacillus colini]|uniref:Membrane protein n=1 Tax=Lactobacillus colini TaxID=1819254 RepID=A0ABS4MFK5_9LACO|nr:TMEM175 family protein [Lactobacillus colini]MBP2058443.1 putative membrane protein [Lactobacillus colini]